ncbi:ankyrin repeat domain-containing protein, partial [Wolbachia endosymbiont of Nasonia vitripennis]
GVDPNQKDNEGKTPLHLAAERGMIEVALKLLSAQSTDIHALAFNRHSPLHLAILNQQFSFTKLLVINLADITQVDKSGNNCFHLAAQCSDEKIMDFLIKSKEYKPYINMLNKRNQSPLHVALVSTPNSLSLIQILIDHGAEVNLKDGENYFPLHLAVMKKDIEIMKLLVNAGADVNLSSKDHGTPLQLAVKDDEVDLVETLVKLGADLKAKDKDGYTPLHVAVRMNFIEMVTTLVKLGADLEARDVLYRSPIFHAVELDHRCMLLHLKESGANLEAKDRGGRTPLILAVEKKNLYMVDALISCTSYSRREVLRAALDIAIQANYVEIVDYIVRFGPFKLETKGKDGNTPLHVAVRTNS